MCCTALRCVLSDNAHLYKSHQLHTQHIFYVQTPHVFVFATRLVLAITHYERCQRAYPDDVELLGHFLVW